MALKTVQATFFKGKSFKKLDTKGLQTGECRKQMLKISEEIYNM